MTEGENIPVIAIDGGGTRCRLALGRAGQDAVVETGPANVSTDFDGAVQQIVSGLASLSRQTGESLSRLAQYPAFVGLAGITGPAIATRLRAALPFSQVQIADDRPAALRGALGTREGIVAHFGTGSFFAIQKDGDMRFSGGWGPVLGDEASAQWMGRRALRAVLAFADGLGSESPLCCGLMSEFTNTAGIVRFATNASPEEFGALAPRVTYHAAQGDNVARAIMAQGIAVIAETLPAMGWRPGDALCLTGGLGPQYAAYLPVNLREALIKPEAEPLFGAVALAREFAKGAIHGCH